jgi:hypothetical protein
VFNIYLFLFLVGVAYLFSFAFDFGQKKKQLLPLRVLFYYLDYTVIQIIKPEQRRQKINIFKFKFEVALGK